MNLDAEVVAGDEEQLCPKTTNESATSTGEEDRTPSNVSGEQQHEIMARLTDLLLGSLIPALILLHLYLSPYTKVEESFNIQATHDILKYGIPSSNVTETFRAEYDHFSFPGAVPRTFVGALVLSGLAKPFIWLDLNLDKQLLVRGLLGLFNAFALLSFARGVRRAFGKVAAAWYILLQASQFHVIYYASRTLPNMFAFGICTTAMCSLLPEITDPKTTATKFNSRRQRLALYLLTITGIVFRSEVALLLATTTVYLFLQGRAGLRREIIPAGVSGVLIGLFVTVSVDSFFWQQYPLWPELAAFKFNVLSGQSSAWGVQPWHFYFSNALPRLLLNPVTYIVGIPLACFLPHSRRASASLMIPPLSYIALYSFVPHKEWRFIIYTIPSLTAASAIGISYIWTHRTKSLIYRFLSLGVILSTLCSFGISTLILLPASMTNYPGADALIALHAHAHNTKTTISVHLNNLSCQTGITRFMEMPPPKSQLRILPGSPEKGMRTLRSGASRWIYDKTEDEQLKQSAAFWDKFDYVLVEDAGALPDAGKWEMVREIEAFGGLHLVKPGEKGIGSDGGMLIAKGILGDVGVKSWALAKDMGRKLTGGWWVELKMVPRIKIMKRLQ